MRVLLPLMILATITIPSAEATPINIAQGKPASANSVYSTDVPERAVDGDWYTLWNSGAHGTAGSPQWLTIDLQSLYPIDLIRLVFDVYDSSYAGYTNVYNLYRSDDMSTWVLVGSGTLVDFNDPIDEFTPGGQQIRGLKYEVVGGSHWASLYELAAYTDIDDSSVPEPSTFLLIGAGLGFLVLKSRSATRV